MTAHGLHSLKGGLKGAGVLTFMVWTILLSLALFLVLTALGAQFVYLRKAYFIGITLWSSWLPVVCAGLFVMLLGMNLTSISGSSPRFTNLNHYFSTAEMLILFVVSPLLFTRVNNVVGAAIAIYCLERLILGSNPLPATQSILLLMGCSTTVGVLGDKMPWHLFSRPNPTAHRLREILILLMSLAALAVVFATLIHFREFTNWLSHYFDWHYSPKVSLIGLAVIFMGWLTVALGLTRHFVLPIVCLPSIFTFAYITHWPAYVLVVPFAAGLALSLAVTDRRIVRRG